MEGGIVIATVIISSLSLFCCVRFSTRHVARTTFVSFFTGSATCLLRQIRNNYHKKDGQNQSNMPEYAKCCGISKFNGQAKTPCRFLSWANAAMLHEGGTGPRRALVACKSCTTAANKALPTLAPSPRLSCHSQPSIESFLRKIRK